VAEECHHGLDSLVMVEKGEEKEEGEREREREEEEEGNTYATS